MVTFSIPVEIDPKNAEAGAKKVEDRLNDMKHAGEGFNEVLKKAGELFVSFEAAKAFVEAAESAEHLERQLELVTSGAQDLYDVQHQLFEISNETHTSVETTVDTYQKLALATRELGISQGQLLNFQANLQKTILASGTSADTASQALVALTRAFSNGVVDGRALRTIMADIPTAADAIAQHLGVTRSGLKALGDAGKISGQDLFEAFQKTTERTDELASRVPTLDQSFVDLKNNFVKLVGDIEHGTGIVHLLAAAVEKTAHAVDDLDAALFGIADNAGLDEQGKKLNGIGDTILQIQNTIKTFRSTGQNQDLIPGLERMIQDLQGSAKAVIQLAQAEKQLKVEEDEHAKALKARNDQDVKTQVAVDEITKKLEGEAVASHLLVTGTQEQYELQQLLLPLQEKDKKNKIELNTQQTQDLLQKIKIVDLLKEEAKAYQDIIGPEQEYERTKQGLIQVDARHPELIAQTTRKLEEARVKYLETGTSFGAGFERAFLKLKLEAEDFASVAEKSVNAFADDATDALLKFVQTGKFSFANFTDAIIADLERILVRALVVQAIAAFVPGGGAVLAAGTPALSGAHASGGTEQPGRSYLVGENGPEIHTPGQTGSTAPIAVGGGAPQVSLKLVNVSNPQEISEHLNSGDADQAIVNVLVRTREKANRALGR